VIVEGDDLYGDGVNIAARIEALGDAGGVFALFIYDQILMHLPMALASARRSRRAWKPTEHRFPANVGR
jgi:class 3 adenylate cyclase